MRAISVSMSIRQVAFCYSEQDAHIGDKDKWPRQETCGTPHVVSNLFDVLSLIETSVFSCVDKTFKSDERAWLKNSNSEFK